MDEIVELKYQKERSCLSSQSKHSIDPLKLYITNRKACSLGENESHLNDYTSETKSIHYKVLLPQLSHFVMSHTSQLSNACKISDRGSYGK